MIRGEQGRLAVILAAGEGTRMKSTRPKVLHEVAGRSMIGHCLAAAQSAGVAGIAVVIGPGRADVEAEIRRQAPDAEIFVQLERRGTAHAVLAAREALRANHRSVLILFGDTPLVEAKTLMRMIGEVEGEADVAALGFEAQDPTGYGRFIVEDGELVAIREQKDAGEAERAIRTCNAGLMALAGAGALSLLEAVGDANSQREFYLTDVVGIARSRGLKVVALCAPAEEVLGVNDRVQLAAAEATCQTRLRLSHLQHGVSMVAPETVFFQYDTTIAPDVVIEPHVVFGARVTIDSGSVIRAFSHIDGATIGTDTVIGPYARLRPGARIGAQSRIGNFVEIKAAEIGAGAKIGHLSYIGDATVGADANIGAGTITCNYDGYNKSTTVIGENAFIGSNTALVAPVTVGRGAFIGAGSVIVSDVPDNALGVARGRQIVKAGWGSAYHAAHAAPPVKSSGSG